MTELLVKELEDSKTSKLCYKARRKPSTCLDRSSAQDEIINRCCAVEARVTEEVDVAPFQVAPFQVGNYQEHEAYRRVEEANWEVRKWTPARVIIITYNTR